MPCFRKVMLEIVFAQTWYILFVCQLTLAQKNDCDKGWFGSKCQFKCRCEKDLCDTDGSCQTGIRCKSGWFGFKCQYRDIKLFATVNTIPPGHLVDSLTDGDNKTCNYHKDLQSIEFTLEQRYPFTWMRIVNENITAMTKVFVSFKLDKQPIECRNQSLTLLGVETVEIKCDNYVIVNAIILQGDIIKSMCSVYINGGRNVALRGMTNSSSSYGIADNHRLAVDGNDSAKFSDDSCMHSGFFDNTPRFTLTFSEPFFISRFVVYNRGDCCSERLAEFLLETRDQTGSTNFNFTAPRDVKIVYTVLPQQPLEVSFLKIQLTKSLKGEKILTLCEVELFGDCPPTKWGLECDKVCDSNCPTSCRVQDGTCVTHCIGFDNPPYCTNKCPQGRCGINCGDKCPANDTLSKCSGSTGGCEGCADNSTGTSCTRDLMAQLIDVKGFGAGFGAGVGAMILISSIAIIIIQVCLKRRKRTVQLRSTYDQPLVMEDDSHGYEQVKAGKKSSIKSSNQRILQQQSVDVQPTGETKLSEYESIDSV